MPYLSYRPCQSSHCVSPHPKLQKIRDSSATTPRLQHVHRDLPPAHAQRDVRGELSLRLHQVLGDAVASATGDQAPAVRLFGVQALWVPTRLYVRRKENATVNGAGWEERGKRTEARHGLRVPVFLILILGTKHTRLTISSLASPHVQTWFGTTSRGTATRGRACRGTSSTRSRRTSSSAATAARALALTFATRRPPGRACLASV